MRELVDGSQNVRARYDYDPYGKATKTTGDKDSSFQFAGYYHDVQSDLFLTQFRAYEPNNGRWLSEDPIGMVDSENLYAYVLNNPLRYRDPLGLQATCAVDDCLKKCLGEIFREPIPDITIRPNANHVSNYMITSPSNISLPANMDCDDFFARDDYIAHEYYHIMRQWRAGTMTFLLYILEVVDSGSWSAPDNRYEQAAEEFAIQNAPRLQRCRRQCAPPSC
jgi:RHS repeat-associated protein